MEANKGKIFYEDESAVIAKQVTLKADYKHLEEEYTLDEYYDIENTTSCIKTHNFQKIALQFPDELLHYSSTVYEKLKIHLKDCISSLFILGDTSYGSCCVDEVAAEHLGADCVVHYGSSCLSRTTRLPVYYVFGKRNVDIDDFLEKLRSRTELSKEEPFIIFYDVCYSHLAEELKKRAHELHMNLTVTEIAKGLRQPQQTKEKHIQSCHNCGCKGNSDDARSNAETTNKECNFIAEADNASTNSFCGRTFDVNIQERRDCNIVYIGMEGITLTNLMMTNNHCKFYTYDPASREFRQETLNVSKPLMRRYYLVQRAKDADIIGILVGTLGVANYMEIIEYLKKIIKGAGKKYYTLVVGKLNVAKLANFQEIDIFVVVACPENSMVDSNEFFKPVITPFELEIALVRGKEWTGEYTTDFAKVLPGLKAEENEHQELEEEEEEEVRFSFISGSIKENHKLHSGSKASSSTEVSVRNDNTELTSWSPAGEFLSKRTFVGLDPQLGKTPISQAVQGRIGTPMGYQGEGQ